jgi:uncharacterized protein YbjT (DUF2867 family)
VRVLVTGANGYIGRKLLPALAAAGHEVIAMVRHSEELKGADQVVVADLGESTTLTSLPQEIDAVYYLVHSMSGRGSDFDALEKKIAENFVSWVDGTTAKQVIYLTGLVPKGEPSKHLASRQAVEEVLRTSRVPVTALRTGVVVGSGSASFEIIRDLVEKLPVMVAPRWLQTRCQPIAIDDALVYLVGVLGNEAAMGKSFEIGGPEVLTYEEVLRRFAKVRGLKRRILVLPILTPRLSSYWLVFVTRVDYALARHLVEGLKNEVVVGDHTIDQVVHHQPIGFDEALRRAFSSEGWPPG